ncbi:MAG: hypothetical protein JWN26_254 [Candidatus Saccharibacteria bacterium]|nr:hypothetical protein [Candidatus Saccharibacteria bacterium]
MWGVRVADKGRVRRSMKQLQRVKTWQLVILLILAGFLAATFLRLNNIGMVERRAAVQAADDGGNSDTIINRLYDLQRFVTAHMNADMGKGVYLVSSYKRDVQVAYTKASSDTNPNGNIYEKAQEVCAPKFTRWSEAYVQCTTSELAKYPAAANLEAAVNLPHADSYLYDYVSPLWSPDFAGWSVLVCVALILMIIARLISVAILRVILHQQYKSI